MVDELRENSSKCARVRDAARIPDAHLKETFVVWEKLIDKG